MGRADQGPFDLACMILGTETLLTEMAEGDSDEPIFELLEYTSEAYTLYAKIFIESIGVGAVPLVGSHSWDQFPGYCLYRPLPLLPNAGRFAAGDESDGRVCDEQSAFRSMSPSGGSRRIRGPDTDPTRY